MQSSLIHTSSDLPWLTPNKVAAFCGTVGLVFMILSVWHLTIGIARVTQDSTPIKIHSVLMAICIDASIVGSELALIVASKKAVLTHIRLYSIGMLFLMLTTSAGLNILHLTEGLEANSLFFWLATCWGIIIPVAVFAMFQQAAKLWLYQTFETSAKTASPDSLTESDLASADYVKAQFEGHGN